MIFQAPTSDLRPSHPSIVRIISGTFRSRRLRVPRGRQTRPTSDRAREALFARLGPIEGVRVADLFAGSGALGLEALSRGAASCTFVESGRDALAALHANLADLAPAGAQVVTGRLPTALARLSGPFDLLLLDPPYAAEGLLAATLERLAASPLLARGALVVVEHTARSPLSLPSTLHLEATHRVGETAFSHLYAAASS